MSQSTHRQTALIVGAGLGGLTAALALARLGWDVRVIEKSARLSEVGAGIQLSPNAMHVLNALGVGSDVEQVAFEPEASTIRDHATGYTYVEVPLKRTCQRRYGARYFHIHRADLHSLLEQAAREAGVTILLDQTAKSVTQTEDQVHLATQTEVHTGDILIGADGLRSTIRDALLGPEPPAFTGQVAWRGTVPTDALPKGLIAPNATVWVGPKHHFVTYYLRSGSLVNFVAVQERPDWTKTGWTERGDINELRKAFGDWHPEIKTLLNATTECFLWALFGRDPLPKWSDRRVTLVGDAAHPMLPFMAQGAAMAMEDAWVLADKLAAYPALQVFRHYEAARKPRATLVQQMSQDNARLFHRSDSLLDLWPRAKLRAASIVPNAAFLQLDKVYGVNVTQVSR